MALLICGIQRMQKNQEKSKISKLIIELKLTAKAGEGGEQNGVINTRKYGHG